MKTMNEIAAANPWKKLVGYAYATSPLATRHGHKETGCYYLATQAVRADGALREVIITVHRTKEEARLAGEAMTQCEWSRWTM